MLHVYITCPACVCSVILGESLKGRLSVQIDSNHMYSRASKDSLPNSDMSVPILNVDCCTVSWPDTICQEFRNTEKSKIDLNGGGGGVYS